MSGASGFVGRKLVPALSARGDEVIAISRSPDRTAASLGIERAVDWEGMPSVIAEGVDAVIHLAGETVQDTDLTLSELASTLRLIVGRLLASKENARLTLLEVFGYFDKYDHDGKISFEVK